MFSCPLDPIHGSGLAASGKFRSSDPAKHANNDTGWQVVAVQIPASKPRGLFDASVRSAMLQYGCQSSGAQDVVALQTFEFRVAD